MHHVDDLACRKIQSNGTIKWLIKWKIIKQLRFCHSEDGKFVKVILPYT